MAPSDLADTLRRAAITAELTVAGMNGANDRIEVLERELAARPTSWAYEAACNALRHWRDEAARLAKLAGVEPHQMEHQGGDAMSLRDYPNTPGPSSDNPGGYSVGHAFKCAGDLWHVRCAVDGGLVCRRWREEKQDWHYEWLSPAWFAATAGKREFVRVKRH